MKDPEWLKTNWAVVEKQLKVDKVYLEVHRDLIIVDPETLRQPRRSSPPKGSPSPAGSPRSRMREGSLRLSTTPTRRTGRKSRRSSQRRRRPSTNSSWTILLHLEQERQRIAQKGDRSWTDFRLELMTEVSRDLVLDVARASTRRSRSSSNIPIGTSISRRGLQSGGAAKIF